MLNTSLNRNRSTGTGWLRRLAFAFVTIVAGINSGPVLGAVENVAPQMSWPAVTREQRPWAYWWWMGSAVDKTNLTRELTRYHDAGYGGVHVIPIYGAKGWEDHYIEYLSPKWMEMLRHTVSEARRLDLGVDMTTGSGWCFGGPRVTDADANATVVSRVLDVPANGTLTNQFDSKSTLALVAFSPGGASVDLTKRIRSDGRVDWNAKDSSWRVYAVSQKPSGQKVKRAAIGGEGHMLNLIYPDAMRNYLRGFDEAFAHYNGPKPRAQYHDSYEYKSEWSPDFFAQFEKRRGYRLQTELPALFDKRRDDHTARVLCDYRETVSDIMVEESLPLWTKWSRSHGFLTRNEAHGSPGNLLDLYALADIPETEMFNKDRNKLISKFASSAAHVAGKNLVACETGTWLAEHFTETLADMKYLLDDLFLSGVNHVIYHGTCYSPDEAGWPGWLFYASYEMNPRNSVWRDVPALNAYVARCQSVLQSGQPDNDILLYWPIHDFWSQPGGRLLPHMTVHARDWFEAQPIGRTAEKLWNRGYSFDYLSDRQLATAKVKKRRIEMTDSIYRVVVVPACERMPVATLKHLLELSESGATVIFESALPKGVPGLADLEKRQAQLKNLLDEFKWTEAGAVRETKTGKGRLLVGELEAALAVAGVPRETMFDHAGLMCMRRTLNGERYYFVANRGERAFTGQLPLACTAQSVVAMDPLSGRTGLAAIHRMPDMTGVNISLNPGESVILRALDRRVEGPAWPYWQATGNVAEVNGDWRLDFISGGPALPSAIRTRSLDSWAKLGGEDAQCFAGTVRYSVEFDAPAVLKPETRPCLLDLGKVCQSARVRLNGKDFGTVITPPFRVAINNLNAKGNLLEVEVTNVSANRIRDLDRRGVKWRNFHDINFVNLNYHPFDASDWPLTDSGLLGPVTLTEVKPTKGETGSPR